jgi:predicted alpha/beta hydrolase family esterase
VAVRSRVDPQVEFNTRLALQLPDGTWKAVVFSIERAGHALAEFGGVRLDDELEISMEHFVSVLKCIPPQ